MIKFNIGDLLVRMNSARRNSSEGGSRYLIVKIEFDKFNREYIHVMASGRGRGAISEDSLKLWIRQGRYLHFPVKK